MAMTHSPMSHIMSQILSALIGRHDLKIQFWKLNLNWTKQQEVPIWSLNKSCNLLIKKSKSPSIQRLSDSTQANMTILQWRNFLKTFFQWNANKNESKSNNKDWIRFRSLGRDAPQSGSHRGSVRREAEIAQTVSKKQTNTSSWAFLFSAKFLKSFLIFKSFKSFKNLETLETLKNLLVKRNLIRKNS